MAILDTTEPPSREAEDPLDAGDSGGEIAEPYSTPYLEACLRYCGPNHGIAPDRPGIVDHRYRVGRRIVAGCCRFRGAQGRRSQDGVGQRCPSSAKAEHPSRKLVRRMTFRWNLVMLNATDNPPAESRGADCRAGAVFPALAVTTCEATGTGEA